MRPLGVYLTICNLVLYLWIQNLSHFIIRDWFKNQPHQKFEWFWKVQFTSWASTQIREGWTTAFSETICVQLTLFQQHCAARTCKQGLRRRWDCTGESPVPFFTHSAFCNIRRHIYRDARLFSTQSPSTVLSQGKHVDEALSLTWTQWISKGSALISPFVQIPKHT